MAIPRTDNGRANRVRLEVPVHLQEGSASCTGVAKNIGPGGVFVATVQHAWCRIARHRDAQRCRATATPIAALAEVRWCRPFVDLHRSAAQAWGCVSSTRRCAPPLLAKELRRSREPDTRRGGRRCRASDRATSLVRQPEAVREQRVVAGVAHVDGNLGHAARPGMGQLAGGVESPKRTSVTPAPSVPGSHATTMASASREDRVDDHRTARTSTTTVLRPASFIVARPALGGVQRQRRRSVHARVPPTASGCLRTLPSRASRR